MAFNLSITEFVILTLSVLALAFGGIFLVNLAFFSQGIVETDLPTPYLGENTEQSLQVELVVESSAQQGSVFVITANHWSPTGSQTLPITVENNDQQIEMVLFDDGKHHDGEANDGKYGALFDSNNLALGTYTIKDAESNTIGEFEIQDSACVPLIGSPSHEKINFLLIPSGYTNMEEFKQDVNKLILGTDSLSQIEPFKTNFDTLAFSYIEPNEELGCEVGCRNIETMVCCDESKILKAAEQCHYDQIIVIINSKVGCGTASYYSRVCSKSDLAPKILAHELGHSFGGLADEYVYAEFFDSYSIPESTIKQMPNCAEEGCEKWADITDECHKGCTSADLYRPSKNSIMRYASNGIFNEVSKTALLDEIASHIQRERLLHAQNPQWRSYYVNLEYDNGEISLSPPKTIPVKPGIRTTNGHFTANLLTKDKTIIESVQLPLPLINRPALDISGKPFIETKFTMPVVLPFNPEADSLEIADETGVLATTSLAIFSERCGDGLCGSSENRVSCARDCTLEGDDFCEPGRCDPDCEDSLDCQLYQGEEKNYTWLIVLMILAAVGIVAVMFRAQRTKT